MFPEEVAAITEALGSYSIEPENTRIRKIKEGSKTVYAVLQASVETGSESFQDIIEGSKYEIRVEKGDHSEHLSKVCDNLDKAWKCARDSAQRDILQDYIKSFKTGSLDAYRESQKKWVANTEPPVEDIFGFVEQYHDPQGVRAEWQGLVAIPDAGETAILTRFVAESSKFIRMLPWTAGCKDNNGKGPFEKDRFKAPEFTSIHSKRDAGFLSRVR